VQAFAAPGARKSGNRRSFSEEVMHSLDAESDKARKLTTAARLRLHAAQEELDILTKLHSSLASNEQDWQRKVSAADSQLTSTEKKCREGIPKLEKTVSVLMQRMDKLDAEEKEEKEMEEKAKADRRALAASTAGSSSSGAGGGVRVGASGTSSAGEDTPDSFLPAPADGAETDETKLNIFDVSPPPVTPAHPARLLRQISSDYAELNALHAVYPFVPNSEQVRPTPEVKELKAARLREITSLWRDFVDYIFHTVFNCPFLETEDERRVVANRHRAAISTGRRTAFRPNIFPYQSQGHHYVMWYGTKDQQRSDEEISQDIHVELTQIQGSDKFDFAWYVNPNMTIPELFHVQVFWTPWEE